MTGESTFFPPSELKFQEDNKDSLMLVFSNPLTPEEIDEHIAEFDTIEKVTTEMNRLQGLLLLVESRDFKSRHPPEYIKQLIGYFTQLFKAILIKRERMISRS